jgi:GNAT superfamily N-acetyltransferase
VIAVDPGHHRAGVGSRLVERLESEVQTRGGVRLLHVKTLGPSDPDPEYGRTRAFYHALGFLPLFESDLLFGPDNPAVVLVKPLP